MDLNLPSPVEPIQEKLFEEKNISVFIKRDDLIHPFLCGNKWRKLKYILQDAQEKKAKYLVSFGGAYSNHLIALAFAGKSLGLKTIAFVRGDEERELNGHLQKCQEFGMEMVFVSREAYRHKEQLFKDKFGEDADYYFIDEGGSGPLAMKGMGEMMEELEEQYDHIFIAMGTGASYAGLSNYCHKKKLGTTIEGISVLRGNTKEIHHVVTKHLSILQVPKIHTEFHCGGYAKKNPELVDFIQKFEEKHSIPLETIYTGKTLLALYRLAEQNYFISGAKILVVHSGGVF